MPEQPPSELTSEEKARLTKLSTKDSVKNRRAQEAQVKATLEFVKQTVDINQRAEHRPSIQPTPTADDVDKVLAHIQEEQAFARGFKEHPLLTREQRIRHIEKILQGEYKDPTQGPKWKDRKSELESLLTDTKKRLGIYEQSVIPQEEELIKPSISSWRGKWNEIVEWLKPEGTKHMERFQRDRRKQAEGNIREFQTLFFHFANQIVDDTNRFVSIESLKPETNGYEEINYNALHKGLLKEKVDRVTYTKVIDEGKNVITLNFVDDKRNEAKPFYIEIAKMSKETNKKDFNFRITPEAIYDSGLERSTIFAYEIENGYLSQSSIETMALAKQYLLKNQA